MDTAQINLIKSSWDRLIHSTFAHDQFYWKLYSERVFEDLYSRADRVNRYNTIQDEARRFIQALTIVVFGIEKIDEALDEAAVRTELSRKNWTPCRLQGLQTAFLWALKSELKKNWSPELQLAWQTVNEGIAHSLLRAKYNDT